MKKYICIMLSAFMMMSAMTGCGSKSYQEDVATAPSEPPMTMNKVNPSTAGAMDSNEMEEEVGIVNPSTGTGGNEEATPVMKQEEIVPPEQQERKIVWTVHMELEALAFDDLISSTTKRVDELGGYLESSDISGSRRSDGRESRYARLVLRVPSKDLDAFLDEVGTMANVTSLNKQRDDITFEYTDTENRMKSLRIEQEKLFDLLNKATDLESIIRLEERLTQVRYEIENYNSTLKLYDNQVNYSTVYLNINEVLKISQASTDSIGSRISTGFTNTLYNLKIFAENLLIYIIVYSPVLIILAAIIAIVIVILKRRLRKEEKQDKLPKQTKEKPKTENVNDYKGE